MRGVMVLCLAMAAAAQDCSNGNDPQRYDCNKRNLTAFPSLATFVNAKNVQVSHNLITSLPEALGGPESGLSIITDFYADYNQIKTIPADTFFNLTKLSTLYLSSNKLEGTLGIGGPFRLTPKLKSVYLDQNLLTAIHPDTFAHNPDLFSLSVGYNYITSLPPRIFANNRHLSIVVFSYNKLHALPLNLLANVSGLIEGYFNIDHEGHGGFTCKGQPVLGDGTVEGLPNDNKLHMMCSCPIDFTQKTEDTMTCCVSSDGPDEPCFSPTTTTPTPTSTPVPGPGGDSKSSASGPPMGIIIGVSVGVCVCALVLFVAKRGTKKGPSGVYNTLPTDEDDEEMIEMMADVAY